MRYNCHLTANNYFLSILAVYVLSSNAWAGSLITTAKSDKGAKVSDAVVSLTPVNISATLLNTSVNTTAVMDQIGKQFVPYVLPVYKGASVSFPNKDNIKYHVYSFSKAKRFELKLYRGTASEPVVIERYGAVSFGCNIHDWMLGFIYVLDTPLFAKTSKKGIAKLA